MEIERGSRVIARDAAGRALEKRAVGGVEVEGHDFPVVLVARPEEWDAALAEDREPDAVPWPAEDVTLAVEAARA